VALRIKVLLKTGNQTMIPAISTFCHGVSSSTRRDTLGAVTSQGVFYLSDIRVTINRTVTSSL